MFTNLSLRLLRQNVAVVKLQVPPSRNWGRLRTKYLNKSPIVRVDPDGSYHVEGVSNKQTPIPVLWKEPVKIERVTPGVDGSGDLEGLPTPDLSRPPVELALSPLWKDAPPEVRRVLSLEFGRNRELVQVVQSDLVKKVQEHEHDSTSLPVVIAKLTVIIRNKQRDLAERFPHKNNILKHSMKINIDSRRALLRYLREIDYKKFEWLLEKLNIAYKPRPLEYEAINRFVHQERLVDLWCDELKHYKLQSYKEKLEAEQPEFLRHKAEKLKWIMEEEQALGVKATVTQADIDDCYEKAKQIEAKIRTKTDEWPYHIYAKEERKTSHVFRN